MLYHASHTMHIRTPMLRGVHVRGTTRTLITDFIEGVTVHKVQKGMSSSNENSSYKA